MNFGRTPIYILWNPKDPTFNFDIFWQISFKPSFKFKKRSHAMKYNILTKIQHVQLMNINSTSDSQIIWLSYYQRCENEFNNLNKDIKILQLYFTNLLCCYMKMVYVMYEQSWKFSEYLNEISRIAAFTELPYTTQRIISCWSY